ncbi:MAG TPA: S4 domain-containing protein [Gemmatimonadales bacterium]
MTDAVRLDKWLWAARFYKTRAAATAAVAGGKVQLNGERPKPAKPLHPGDALRIRLGPYEHHVVVRGLAEKRGPASAAQRLYEETPASLAARLKLAQQLRTTAPPTYDGKGRPTKRDRRDLDRLKGE